MYIGLSIEVFCKETTSIILTRKRELFFLLLLSLGCLVTVTVMWLFFSMPWVGLQFVIVVIPDHTHLILQRRLVQCHQHVTIFNVNNQKSTYKLKKIVGSNNFSAQFIKIISHYKKIGYNINVLQQTACLVVNPITVGNFAFLFNCTPVGRTSDSMMVPT